MVQNTLIITLCIILSAILGFITQIVFTSTFGVSDEMDIYFKILSLPAIVTGISPIIFSSVLIPTFAKFKDNKLELSKFVNSLWAIIFALGVIFTIFGIIFTVINMEYFISNNENYFKIIGIHVSLMVWIGSGFMVMSGYLSAILNYNRQFLKVACTNILPALCIIIMVLLFHEKLGVRSIALGFCFAFSLQFIILLKASKVSFKLFSINIKKIPHKNLLVSQSFLVTLSLLPFTVLVPIGYFFASKLEIGSISYLGYSQSFAGFLSVAVSMGISIASFPELADKFANKKEKLVLYKLEKSLSLVLIIGMFSAGALIVLRTPILSLFYERGSFNSESVNNLAKVIPWYLLGAVFVGGVNLLRNLFYSKGDFKSIAIIGLIIPVIFYLLAEILKERFSFVGIGIANALTCGILFFSTICLAKYREDDFLKTNFFVLLIKSLLAVLITSLFVAYASNLISKVSPQLLTIVVCLFIFTIIYYLISKFIFKIKEIEEIISPFKSKLKSFNN